MESGPVLGWYVDEWIIVKLEQVDEDCPLSGTLVVVNAGK